MFFVECVFDPVLSFQLREGFRYCGIMYGNIAEDAVFNGNAALIVWPTTCTKKTAPQIAAEESYERTL